MAAAAAGLGRGRPRAAGGRLRAALSILIVPTQIAYQNVRLDGSDMHILMWLGLDANRGRCARKAGRRRGRGRKTDGAAGSASACARPTVHERLALPQHLYQSVRLSEENVKIYAVMKRNLSLN